MTETQKLETKKYLPWVVGLIILLDSLYFRTAALRHTGYWIDEMSSVHFAGHERWSALFWDNSPPLYHFILKFWMKAFGNFEVATRSLSAIFSTTCTVLWMRFGFKRHGLIGLVFFGLCHAIYSLSISHGRETRMYALFELASTNLFFIFVDLFEGTAVSKTRKFSSVLFALLTHALALLPILVGFGFLIFKNKISLSIRQKWALGSATIFVISITLYYVRLDNLGWQQFKFEMEPASHWPWLVIYEILQGAVGATAAVLALLLAIATARKGQRTSSLTILFWAFFVTIFAAATLAGFISARSVFLTRYFFFLTPLLIYLMVNPFLEYRGQPARFYKMTAALFLLLFMSGELMASLKVVEAENADWRGAADIVAQTDRPKIYTTLPLSMRSPYFDAYKIEFEKIAIYTPTIFEPLLEGFKQKYDVWIIENYWGFYVVAQSFNEFTKKHNCTWRDYTLRSDKAEPVVLIQVFCGDSAIGL